jgi:murein DD-endopeptidase MepM/ murein hydrolase activator NlpD
LEGEGGELVTTGGSALVASHQVLSEKISTSGAKKKEISTYVVTEGDTLSSIAARNGISASTLASSNGLRLTSTLRMGQELLVLPVDGAVHRVVRGETVSSIARRYGVAAASVVSANGLEESASLAIGKDLIVPGAKSTGGVVNPSAAAPKSAARELSAPLLDLGSTFFGLFAQGRRTQGLHSYNAVDWGGSGFCNTAVYAAAAGTVITSDAAGWNGGYGNYIKISHENGTVTLYAHNAQNLVSAGEKVDKGEVIALMGRTGNATGCHVHFEIRGAQNPFAR